MKEKNGERGTIIRAISRGGRRPIWE